MNFAVLSNGSRSDRDTYRHPEDPKFFDTFSAAKEAAEKAMALQKDLKRSELSKPKPSTKLNFAALPKGNRNDLSTYKHPA